jgi:NADH-quinone oxidoreductase subunit J
MPWDVIVFYMVAAVCVLCALGIVAANNPTHAAIFLVMTFFNVAAIFVMLGAEFLAVIQVIVYTGAILVLFLFVLMLVDPDDLPEFHTARPVQRYVGFLLGAILLLEVGVAIIDRTLIGVAGDASPEAIDLVGGNTQALGRTLYTTYLFPFEVVSLVLTVGVIGAIVLATPERLGERLGTRRGTISLGHARGVDDEVAAIPAGESPIPAGEPVKPAASAETGFVRTLVMAKNADDQPVVGKK